jgi:rubrerythrin
MTEVIDSASRQLDNARLLICGYCNREYLTLSKEDDFICPFCDNIVEVTHDN